MIPTARGSAQGASGTHYWLVLLAPLTPGYCGLAQPMTKQSCFPIGDQECQRGPWVCLPLGCSENSQGGLVEPKWFSEIKVFNLVRNVSWFKPKGCVPFGVWVYHSNN